MKIMNSMRIIFSTKLTAVALTAVALTTGISNAATITFETGQGYTNNTNIGALGGASDAPFTGQQGWSLSTSTGTGRIVTTTTSGEYTGGQGLGADSADTRTYIGGKLGAVEITGINTITFDAMYSTGGAISAGFLGVGDADGLFDNSDAGMQFGGNGSPGATVFYRDLGFGATQTNPSSSGTLVEGKWYRHTITIGEISGANRSITMSVRNLTDATDLDLNGGTAGTSITFSVTNSAFGVAPEAAVGGFIRISNATGASTPFIDNINFTAVPEPSSVFLGSLGMLALLRRRRV